MCARRETAACDGYTRSSGGQTDAVVSRDIISKDDAGGIEGRTDAEKKAEENLYFEGERLESRDTT